MFIFWLSVWFPLWYGREKSLKNPNFRPKKALETDLGSQGRRKNFEKNLMRDKKILTMGGKVISPTSKVILARSLKIFVENLHELDSR